MRFKIEKLIKPKKNDKLSYSLADYRVPRNEYGKKNHVIVTYTKVPKMWHDIIFTNNYKRSSPNN